MLEFLKAPFLVLHFSYYTFSWCNPHDVICDIAVCADDTTLCSKCNQAFDLWLQLELASELDSDLQDIVDWGKKWLADLIAGKTQLILFDWPNNTSSIDMEMDPLRCWGWPSLPNWIGALALSLLLSLSPRNLEPYFVLRSFFLLRLEYCCHIWVGASSYCLEQECSSVTSCFSWTLGWYRNSASLSLFCMYYFGRCSLELAQLAPLPFSREKSTRYSDRLHDFSVTIPRCYKDVYVNSFFLHTARLWNCLPIECLPLI